MSFNESRAKLFAYIYARSARGDKEFMLSEATAALDLEPRIVSELCGRDGFDLLKAGDYFDIPETISLPSPSVYMQLWSPKKLLHAFFKRLAVISPEAANDGRLTDYVHELQRRAVRLDAIKHVVRSTGFVSCQLQRKAQAQTTEVTNG